MKRLTGSVALALLLCACSSPSAGKGSGSLSGSDSAGPRPGALTREQALTRARQVGKTAYTLSFELDDQKTTFAGKATLTFDLREKGRDVSNELLVDFEGGTIDAAVVNGAPLTEPMSPANYDGHHLRVRTRDLKPGANQIEIAFTHPYSTTGNGLERFKDPADGNVYLYSNLEPYNAHLIFPCFDQPDLKASYALTAQVPKNWQVIGNALETEKGPSKSEGMVTWKFPPTAVFSTYVFALHAGPYSSWKGYAGKSDSGGIPIRLFARKSLAKYVDWREWLDITRKGLEFFGTQFGYPYPYGKYDQIIVPDFNAGAMENVGAVTFAEHFVYRTKVTADRRMNRADTILHEMAHMWFGDLVTMRWWNGLWLNESFATFMAAWAVDKSTDFEGSWQNFFAGNKEWAYWEDQLVTTHPIEVSVPDTDQAFANFDGITYGKGASALKQLFYFLGEDNFREGVQRYFMRFAHRNTTLADFMGTLGEASGRNLKDWQKQWLQTTGVNTIQTDWECELNPRTAKPRISKFVLKQLPSEGNRELRPHRTRIALYSKAALTEVLDVEYSKAETEVDEALGKACPDLVFPNHEDQDYVKVALDEKSLKTARKSLAQLSDPFVRQMLWHTLWSMVVDGQLAASDFAEVALSQAPSEKNTKVLAKILGHLATAQASEASVVRFLPPGPVRERQAARIETFLRTRLLGAPGGSDLQIVWFDSFLDAARSKGSLALARGLLDGSRKLEGFEVDQERRWQLIAALARGGAKNPAQLNALLALIAEEEKEDPTDHGRKQAIRAEASIPDATIKQKWIARITRTAPPAQPGEPELKVADLRAALNRLHLSGQEDLSRAAVDAYFDALVRLSPAEDDEYLADVAGDFYPALCEPQMVERLTRFLSEHSSLPAAVVKNVKVNRQEEERCIRARALSGTPVATR